MNNQRWLVALIAIEDYEPIAVFETQAQAEHALEAAVAATPALAAWPWKWERTEDHADYDPDTKDPAFCWMYYGFRVEPITSDPALLVIAPANDLPSRYEPTPSVKKPGDLVYSTCSTTFRGPAWTSSPVDDTTQVQDVQVKELTLWDRVRSWFAVRR